MSGDQPKLETQEPAQTDPNASPSSTENIESSAVFSPVGAEINFPACEAAVLAFWKENRIFHKTLRAESRRTGPSKGTFVFYEGPPTANGMPHNGHVLTRAVKDVFPRYKTMLGFDVPRKAGWDTHGLPVEVEVEKELRIHGKADIERYGVEPFTHRCIASVFRYTDAWEKLTDRIGFWVDLEEAYVTYHKSYVESVWWALGELFKKELLYRGEKVVWWWAQGGTALSSAEVGLGYKTVDDPSVFVAFPIAAESADSPWNGVSLCVWTTTPWTLPSNMYAAVRGDLDYALVDAGDQKFIVASGLREGLEQKFGRPLPVLRTMKGDDLVGLKYTPPFSIYTEQAKPHRVVHSVIAANFVTLDAGTGIVHVAPAFGEDDHSAHRALARQHGALPLFCAVRPDGCFSDVLPGYTDRYVKDCDKELTAELRERKILVHAEIYRHDYPFCWRADGDPLIQFARPAWYIRTTSRIGSAIENNQAVHWLPDHIKTGRFGDFLQNNVDWALSRERYWGTPLNIWVCQQDEKHAIAPCSIAEIEALNPNAFDAFKAARAADPTLSEHLIVHKPWIDQVTLPCPHCGGQMRRVTEVIDCWFDSGCMPFAQWGYPHQQGSKELFEQAFPADFISEAIDQTRGWFYSLLMISTLVFDEEAQKRLGLQFTRSYPHPYKTCVVLGHVCDREGKKESKSKGNYTPPEVIMERVRMEFAAVRAADVTRGKLPSKGAGTAMIAREDYDGLDLTGESAQVVLYRDDRANEPISMELLPIKGMPRRIVALCPEDLERLGLSPHPNAMDILPNDVLKLPLEQRVYIEDPASPAPGADAFRWFFYASSPSWTNTRHSLTNVRAYQKEFAIKLRNVYSFFVIYATIDGFSPADGNAFAKDTTPLSLRSSWGYRPVRDRALLDRWILSELAITTREVRTHLDAYRIFDAASRLVELVDALSNWYVRRSRSRFWAPVGGARWDEAATYAEDVNPAEPSQSGLGDKSDAYFTLYETLVTIAKLIAPFTPFLAEEIYRNLVTGPWPVSQAESVHLAAYPEPSLDVIDEALAAEMRAVRELVSLGLSVRTAGKLKVRQPLSRVDVVISSEAFAKALSAYSDLIADELNVHEVRFLRSGEEGQAVRYVLKPNFRALGPKIGKKVQVLKQVLAKADASALRTALATEGKVTIDLEGEGVELGPEEIEVAVVASEGFAAAGGKAGVVVLHTTLTEELRDEGLFREILSRVQGVRKEMGLGFTERVNLALSGSERVIRVAAASKAALCSEALAVRVYIGEGAMAELNSAEPGKSFSVDGEELILAVKRLNA